MLLFFALTHKHLLLVYKNITILSLLLFALCHASAAENNGIKIQSLINNDNKSISVSIEGDDTSFSVFDVIFNDIDDMYENGTPTVHYAAVGSLDNVESLIVVIGNARCSALVCMKVNDKNKWAVYFKKSCDWTAGSSAKVMHGGVSIYGNIAGSDSVQVIEINGLSPLEYGVNVFNDLPDHNPCIIKADWLFEPVFSTRINGADDAIDFIVTSMGEEYVICQIHYPTMPYMGMAPNITIHESFMASIGTDKYAIVSYDVDGNDFIHCFEAVAINDVYNWRYKYRWQQKYIKVIERTLSSHWAIGGNDLVTSQNERVGQFLEPIGALKVINNNLVIAIGETVKHMLVKDGVSRETGDFATLFHARKAEPCLIESSYLQSLVSHGNERGVHLLKDTGFPAEKNK